MDILLLDTSLATVTSIETFSSIIWTDRYSGSGDFELTIHAGMINASNLQQGYYLWNKDSNYLMIIELMKSSYTEEDGPMLVITGRSIESILDRRIVWNPTILDGNLQNEIQRLLNENAINPVITDRKISLLEFSNSTDPKVTSLTVSNAEYTGYKLFDVITTLCAVNNISFKITLSDSNKFVFKLYAGIDRSYKQSINQTVLFSSKLDNLLSSDFLIDTSNLRTVMLVVGEKVGAIIPKETVDIGTYYGLALKDLARREEYVDASGVSHVINGVTLTAPEYTEMLVQKGLDQLSTTMAQQSFDAKINMVYMYVYNVDFFIGDFVQIVDLFGNSFRVRITEIIQSQDSNGFSIYPTFEQQE